MNRYKSYAGPSKASATTLCQKCLKRGHYSYECTATNQDRPYVARPSRTQQLLNPKLMPKLSSDEPPNPLLRRHGVADEQLAKAAEERGRKRRRLDGSATRSRSASSVSSVSTVSTTLSRSPPPRRSTRSPPPPDVGNGVANVSNLRESERPRQRSTSSTSSRGRSISRPRLNSSASDWSRRRRSRQSRSYSVDQSRNTRSRRTFTPSPMRRKFVSRRDSPSRTMGSNDDRPSRGPHKRQSMRELESGHRSLSPFSRRVALTQAMSTRN